MTSIRRAEFDDAEQLGILHSAVWAELYGGVLPAEILAQLSPAAMGALWQRFTTRGGDYVQYVAEQDGRIVGFVGFGPGRDEGQSEQREVYFLHVHPDARRSGVGSELLAQDADAAYLWVWERNRSAHKFYRRNKFGPDSRRRVGSLFGTEVPEIRFSR
jgi:ribosomal protein S18 acetylase RimI-like enzyme